VKIVGKNGSIWTATILQVDAELVTFVDREGTQRAIAKSEIAEARDMGGETDGKKG
jgi:hypothetical protein